MKIKSGRIRNEIYDYVLDTTVQQFWLSKGRPGGILELVQATIYNASGSSATKVYYLFKHKGVVRRLMLDATLETKTIRYYWGELYLDDGDEIGIEIDGGTNGDKIEMFVQLLWHRDDDAAEFG